MDNVTEFVPMALDTEKGTKIKYLGVNGYPADRQYANRFLIIGCDYTVDSIDVGNWRSTVELVEHKGHRFNTVMFSVKEG